MRLWGVSRLRKAKPPPPPATILAVGYWTKSQLHRMEGPPGHSSPYGAVKIAIDPNWRVSINTADLVTVEVRVTDPKTGMPCWVAGAQYPG